MSDSQRQEPSQEQQQRQQQQEAAENEKKGCCQTDENAPQESPQEKLLRVSKLYFRLGFLLLPWIWAANAAMLYQYRHNRNVAQEVIWYRNWSAICFLISCLVFVIYVIVARTALVDMTDLWIIAPGVSSRQNGLFSQANLAN